MEVTSSVWDIVRNLYLVAQVQRRAADRSPLGPVPLGLLNVASQGPVTPKAAAAALDVPAQSITRAVGELVAAGLVVRVGDRTDGRSYAIELTEQGRVARDRFRDELTGRFVQHLDGWTDEEIVTFAGQLSRLVAALAADLPEPTPGRGGRRPWRPEQPR
jgi:DNA-binding MarR family transcriptional regulator